MKTKKKCIKREKVEKKETHHFEWVQLMDINDECEQLIHMPKLQNFVLNNGPLGYERHIKG